MLFSYLAAAEEGQNPAKNGGAAPAEQPPAPLVRRELVVAN